MGEDAITRPRGFSMATRLRVLLGRPADLDSLRAYIDDQEKHHTTRTFQDEFRMFLKKYGVEYDEAYVWD